MGDECHVYRDKLSTSCPLSQGIVRDWDDMRYIWNYTWQQLKIQPNNHRILLTETPNNTMQNKIQMYEVNKATKSKHAYMYTDIYDNIIIVIGVYMLTIMLHRQSTQILMDVFVHMLSCIVIPYIYIYRICLNYMVFKVLRFSFRIL